MSILPVSTSSFMHRLAQVWRPRTPEVSSRNSHVSIVLLMGVVILLSVFVFSKQSLRLDESQSIWQASHSLMDTYSILASDVHVPLYETLLHFWMVLFGTSVTTVRLLSLIFFLASIPALYRLGSYAYTRNVGVFAALLFCISPFMNWYGNEARMYSLFVLVTILNQLFFMKLWKEQTTTAAWIGYTVTAFLGIYTHYFFFLLLITQAVYYLFNQNLFQKGSFIRFLRTAGILLLSIAPWLLYVRYINRIQNSTPLIPVPTTVNLFNTFSQFLFGFQNDHLNTVLVSLWPMTVLVAFIALRKNNGLRHESVYLGLSIAFPIALTFLESLFFRPIFVSRYLIFTLPALYIFLSSLILTYRYSVQNILKTILVGVMLATLTVEIRNANAPIKENYRDASEYLSAHANPDDIIILSAPFTAYPIQYYYQGSATMSTLPIWDQNKTGALPPFVASELPTQVSSLIKDHANVWLLLSYDQGYEDQVRMYFDTHFQKLQSRNFSYGMDIHQYKIRY